MYPYFYIRIQLLGSSSHLILLQVRCVLKKHLRKNGLWNACLTSDFHSFPVYQSQTISGMSIFALAFCDVVKDMQGEK